MSAKVNGHGPLELMFHTSFSGLGLTREAVQRFPDLLFDQEVSVNSWGGKAQARISTGNELTIGDCTLAGVTILEDQNSGPGTDGKFGPDLFAPYVVTIDFDASRLILSKELPALGPGFDEVGDSVRDGMAFVRATLGNGNEVIEQSFLLHSGYSGNLLLDAQFVAKHPWIGALEVQEEHTLTDSFGNEVRTKTVVLPDLQVGRTHFHHLPVQFFEGTLGQARMSVMGGGLLRRFQIVLDLQGSRVAFQAREGSDSATRGPR
ncbi:MAG: hypothetical protein H6830_12680 [Planctomycetes bacterium]|nr:hypothetical protein [Planctomycetota bacterium]HPF13538.1 hypothetical protein [Planctomycetota bacterium]